MTQTSSADSSREFMRKFYAHMATANIASILASFHDEVEIHEPDCLPYGGVYRGIDGVKQLLSNASKHLDSRVFDVETMLTDGERVISILRTATRGSRTPIHVAEDITIRDGKIHRVHVYLFDPTIIIKAADRSQPRAKTSNVC